MGITDYQPGRLDFRQSVLISNMAIFKTYASYTWQHPQHIVPRNEYSVLIGNMLVWSANHTPPNRDHLRRQKIYQLEKKSYNIDIYNYI